MNDLLILLLLMHSNCSYIFAINNFPLHIFYILKSDQWDNISDFIDLQSFNYNTSSVFLCLRALCLWLIQMNNNSVKYQLFHYHYVSIL